MTCGCRRPSSPSSSPCSTRSPSVPRSCVAPSRANRSVWRCSGMPSLAMWTTNDAVAYEPASNCGGIGAVMIVGSSALESPA